MTFPLNPWLAAGVVFIALLVGGVLVARAAEPGRVHAYTIEAKEAGSKDHGYLGVKLQELTDELREGLGIKARKGVLVSEVIEDSPAAEAGLEDGDIIVEFNRKTIDSPEELQELVAALAAGDEVRMKIVRDNKTKSMDVTIGEWPDEPMLGFTMPEDFDFSDLSGPIVRVMQGHRLGVRLWEMDDNLSSYFGVKKGEGVLVLNVEDESTAADAGIKTGDIIVGIGDKKVDSIDDVRDEVSGYDKGDEFDITVVRKNKKVKLEASMKEAGTWQLGRGFHAPHWRYNLDRNDSDLRKELDELRKEVNELKKQMKDES